MNLEKSIALGAQIIEQTWERMKPNELRKLRKGAKKRILVISGTYDSLEDLLKSAKVPFESLEEFPNKKDLNQGGKYFNSRTIFVNCDSAYHGDLEYKNLTSDNRAALRDFVKRGGRMVTTDWAQNAVQYLFGKIRADENVTEDEVVKVRFANNVAEEMSGVFYGNATPNWWLEGSSDIIRYRKGSGVVSLVESEELKKLYGSKHIAVGFPYGEGEVFHFVSHLKAQRVDNYDAKDRQCLGTFLDTTLTSFKEVKGSKLTFGEVESAYTLMNTVLELCRDGNILSSEGGGGK